jgi:hypothetical protein
MIANHSQFLAALHEKKLVEIKFYSQADAGTVDRECMPLDYGPDSEAKDALNRYWIWDPAAPAGKNLVGVLPAQITSMRVLGVSFEPEKLSLGSRSWSVPRAWGARPGVGTGAIPGSY